MVEIDCTRKTRKLKHMRMGKERSQCSSLRRVEDAIVVDSLGPSPVCCLFTSDVDSPIAHPALLITVYVQPYDWTVLMARSNGRQLIGLLNIRAFLFLFYFECVFDWSGCLC